MSVRRLLIVDNQTSGPDCIEQIVDNLPEDWESQVITNGSQALEDAENYGFDVVVADYQLPDMTGIELLKRMSEQCPGTVRFLLSTETGRELVLQGTGFVHQFIAKPCDYRKFNAILCNSVGLRQILNNENLQTRIASIGSLPSPPQIYNHLVKEMQSETASMRNIAALINKNISITAKLLQVANSAFFGLSSTITTPMQAVNILGLDTVKSLVLATGVFNQFSEIKSSQFSVQSIFNRSVSIGTGARLFATALGLEARATDDSLLGGLLHDVGKLVMLVYFCQDLENAVKMARDNSIPLYQAEIEILGVTDAEIGAYLLSLWGIPDTILEAAAHHYMPNKTNNPILNVLTCVHLAYAFDHEEINENNSALDMDYLQRLGLSEQVEDLRNLHMGAVM